MRIGIDLGGHTLIAALISGMEGTPGRVGIERTIAGNTPSGRCIADVMSAMAGTIAELARGHDVSGVGVAVPGMVDVDRRHNRRLPNFPIEWDDLDISETLSRELKLRGCQLPVAIENDANCYALGEGIAGEAVGMSDFIVLTMGTGIGGGIVAGGRLLTGAHGMAGEVGHVVVGGEKPCGCGGVGHAETLAAADGTSKRAEMAGLPGDFKELWAKRGEPLASSVLDETLDAMARTIATVYHVLDPEIVIIGGGMSRAPGLRESLHERTTPYLSRPFKNMLDVRISKLGNDAALYGAASIAL
ncbi:MAG: ROK family protein [Synergistaceae bacterium]|jgi:glucokinase|nr:ROK family protein [Synergistaceae bacterium]